MRAEMARQGVSQMTLAAKIRMKQTSVSARLRGLTPFDVNELHVIADVLDVPLSKLLAGITDDETPGGVGVAS